VKTAFDELVERRRLLTQQGESIRAQIRAVEDSLKALEPHSLGDVIRLEFTKNEAGVLASVCYHFVARCPGIGIEMSDLINRLGDDLIQAMRDQNADFAERVNRFLYGRRSDESSGGCASRGRDAEGMQPPIRLPKKDRPYLRYSEQQIEEAIASSEVGCRYDYLATGYVRLHLNRAALLEMYSRTRRLKPVYAYFMKRIDDHGHASITSLFGGRFREPRSGVGTTRACPYQHFGEGELKAGLKQIGLSPRQVKLAFGFLTVSLRRSALLYLYRSRTDEPGIAYLIKALDEYLASHRSSR
jgi:hypothetical protein